VKRLPGNVPDNPSYERHPSARSILIADVGRAGSLPYLIAIVIVDLLFVLLLDRFHAIDHFVGPAVRRDVVVLQPLHDVLRRLPHALGRQGRDGHEMQSERRLRVCGHLHALVTPHLRVGRARTSGHPHEPVHGRLLRRHDPQFRIVVGNRLQPAR
jgi:hypothetical protein